MDEAVKVPLRARTGEVRAYALVDTEKAAEVLDCRWYLDARGYARRNGPRDAGKRAAIYLHRQLLEVLRDESVEVDHLSGDRLDNRLANLRLVPPSGNRQNRNFCNTGSSRFRGVSWHRDRRAWQAQVHLDRKNHYLGLFDSEVAAAQVADTYRLKHMPFATTDPELLRYHEERHAVR